MSQARKYVVLRLGREFFGLPIESVERILDARPLTRLPRSPEIVSGVLELRGTTLPVIDLRRRFGYQEIQSEGYFVVVAQGSGPVAFRVDTVDGIEGIADEQVEPSPGWMGDPQDDFVGGVALSGDRMVIVLRPDRLVPTNVRHRLAEELAPGSGRNGAFAPKAA